MNSSSKQAEYSQMPVVNSPPQTPPKSGKEATTSSPMMDYKQQFGTKLSGHGKTPLPRRPQNWKRSSASLSMASRCPQSSKREKKTGKPRVSAYMSPIHTPAAEKQHGHNAPSLNRHCCRSPNNKQPEAVQHVSPKVDEKPAAITPASTPARYRFDSTLNTEGDYNSSACKSKSALFCSSAPSGIKKQRNRLTTNSEIYAGYESQANERCQLRCMKAREGFSRCGCTEDPDVIIQKSAAGKTYKIYTEQIVTQMYVTIRMGRKNVIVGRARYDLSGWSTNKEAPFLVCDASSGKRAVLPATAAGLWVFFQSYCSEAYSVGLTSKKSTFQHQTKINQSLAKRFCASIEFFGEIINNSPVLAKLVEDRFKQGFADREENKYHKRPNDKQTTSNGMNASKETGRTENWKPVLRATNAVTDARFTLVEANHEQLQGVVERTNEKQSIALDDERTERKVEDQKLQSAIGAIEQAAAKQTEELRKERTERKTGESKAETAIQELQIQLGQVSAKQTEALNKERADRKDGESKAENAISNLANLVGSAIKQQTEAAEAREQERDKRDEAREMRYEERFGEMITRQERTEEDVANLKRRQTSTEEDVTDLDERQTRTEMRQTRTEKDVADLRSIMKSLQTALEAGRAQQDDIGSGKGCQYCKKSKSGRCKRHP